MRSGERFRLKRPLQVPGWGTIPKGTEGTILFVKSEGELGVTVSVKGPEDIPVEFELRVVETDVEKI